MGIRANCIAPGITSTDMLQTLSPSIIEATCNQTDLRRLGSPLNIADTAVFLISDLASHITGQTIWMVVYDEPGACVIMKAFWEPGHHGNAIAAINDWGETLSYRELYSTVSRLVVRLQARTLLFLLCDNSFGSLVGYLACLNARAVPLMLDKAIAPELLQQLMERYRPGFIWHQTMDHTSLDSDPIRVLWTRS